MERSHRKLRTRFAYGLRRDYADRFAHLNGGVVRHIFAVTLRAYARLGFAGENTSYLHFFHARFNDFVRHVFGNHFAGFHHNFLRYGIDDVGDDESARNAVA